MHLHSLVVRTVMGLVRTTILAGAVALGLGLTSVAFGVAYLVILAYYPWPAFPSPAFWGHPELGILFVAGGMLAYGEGVWSIRSRLDGRSRAPHDISKHGIGDDRV